jgi:cytochrome c553
MQVNTIVRRVLLAAFVVPHIAASQARPSQPVFETDVLPILEANCVRCHGAKVKSAHLDLSKYGQVLKGGESGAVVVPGKSSESRLYEKIHKGLMPADKKDALSAAQIEIIRKWIDAGAPALSASERSKAEELGEHDVIPLMLMHCTACHGTHFREAGLDLRTRASMLKGGKSGPAIVPGKPAESLILRRIRAGEMPPPKRVLEAGVTLMSAAEADRLQAWIAQGAPVGHLRPDVAGSEPDPLITAEDRQFWSFRAPAAVEIPKVEGKARIRNPIDAFILNKLEGKGLSLSPEADRLTLMRRAYFDLTGLPPEPAEVQAFLADAAPDAYEKMLDRLLASPRYGERWCRYWLDLAGYADHNQAYRYRDYVIRSFNSDKPYDRFLHEQLAGDELVNLEAAPVITQEMMDNLVATGFLRMAPDPTRERLTNFVPDRMQVIADEIDIFSSTVLGLTIKCARCHTHKYDPIPHRDYYRLMDVFKGALDLYDWLQPHKADDATRPVLPLGNRELPYVKPLSNPIQLAEEEKKRVAENQKLKDEIKALQAELDKQAQPLKKKLLEERLSHLPSVLHKDLLQTVDTPPDKRNEVQKFLAERFEKALKIEPEELEAVDTEYRLAAEKIGARIRTVQAKQVPEAKILALWDRGEPSPTYILKRGDPLSPGDPVGPGVPSVLTDGKTPFEVKPPWPGATKTGRRLALAQWLTRPEHPLTARVMVNRIWEHHFGRGIVTTPGDFGRTGALPTHPELLDWLALEFVRQGWSIKSMHRIIMTSATYRQTSRVTQLHEKFDPENILLSRMPMRRMDAETLYDTILLVSGRLDERRFGPSDPVTTRKDGLTAPAEGEKGWRRAIYMKQVPFQIATLLDSFDFPQMTPNCLERGKSNVATQALHLMNDSMIRKQADAFADRVANEAGTDPARQIDRVYLTALSRPPTAEEKKIGLDVMGRLEKNWSHAFPLPSDPRKQALVI